MQTLASTAAVVTPALPDWSAWAARWEAQQNFMVLHRQERFRIMLDVAAEIVGEPQRVLDLACGTGSISRRGLTRFPSAQFVAQDLDPLLMAIGRGTLGDGGGRLTWLRADFREGDWIDVIRPHAPFDVVVTSTALHWLTATDILRIYADLAGVVRPGGVLLNADRLPVAAPAGRFGQATENLRKREVGQLQVREPAESWQEWWTSAESEPAFADLIAERNGLFEDSPSPRDLVWLALQTQPLSGVIWTTASSPPSADR
jgi:ubiquinone/menaquinone biosynthesis C-methylase UbiE